MPPPRRAGGAATQTAWGLKVFDLTSASANVLTFTSLAHSPGTRVLRRLSIDEPLKPDDFRPTEWLHAPRELADWKPSPVVSWPPAPARDEPANVATINLGAVTEKVAASGTSTVTTTSGTTADIPDMSESIATIAGDLVIVTLRMREIKIENLSTSPQNVTVFVEITDGSNNVINGDADDHWTFPLSAAGGGAAFVVVPVNIVTFDSPATLPGVKLVAEGCSPCRDGQRVRVVLHAFRPGVSVAEVELRAAVHAPSGAVVRLPMSGALVTLPAGPSSVVILDLDASTVPPGVYLVEGAILDPISGVTLSRDVLGVVKE